MSSQIQSNVSNTISKLGSGKYELIWDLKQGCFVFKERGKV